MEGGNIELTDKNRKIKRIQSQKSIDIIGFTFISP